MAAEIESTEKSEKTPVASPRTSRKTGRSLIKPLRSLAIFGAVGALVAAVALPAYAAGSAPQEQAAATLQEAATEDAQSLVVASEVTAAPVDRGDYSATTPEEIDKKKAEEAGAAAAAAGGGGGGGSFVPPEGYAPMAPGTGAIRYPLPPGSFSHGRTIVGPDSYGHEGADMLAPCGSTPIYASTAGVVVVSSESYYGYGVGIMIDGVVAGQAVNTVYGHMTYGSRQVSQGDYVQAGQLIGFVGSTGRSTACHLHFEVRVNGSLMEPFAWLAANAG